MRIEYPGAFYHVTARGNERKAIFKATENYEKFIGYLESATERYGADREKGTVLFLETKVKKGDKLLSKQC